MHPGRCPGLTCVRPVGARRWPGETPFPPGRCRVPRACVDLVPLAAVFSPWCFRSKDPFSRRAQSGGSGRRAVFVSARSADLPDPPLRGGRPERTLSPLCDLCPLATSAYLPPKTPISPNAHAGGRNPPVKQGPPAFSRDHGANCDEHAGIMSFQVRGRVIIVRSGDIFLYKNCFYHRW
jgi:hypothetical protein